MPIIQDMTYLKKHNPRAFKKWNSRLENIADRIELEKIKTQRLEGVRSMEKLK